MKKLLLLLASIAALHTHAQIRFSMVNPTTQQLSIKNYGASDVDVSAYRLCALFSYAAVGSQTLVSGDTFLSSGEEVTISWNFNTTSSDMGLYLPMGSFGSASAMVSFFQYGAGGQGRENVAATAGLWTAGTFFSGAGPYYYIGDGTNSGLATWDDQPLSLPVASVLINEVDVDQPALDSQEFIELVGEPGAALDGIVVVFFNGNTGGDASYFSISLDGQSIPSSGFFVLGNAAVPNVNLVFDDNLLQNGFDGIGVYEGTLAQWPAGTLPTATNLIDALVYGTADPADQALIDVLTPGQIQVDEGSANNTTAMARIPDGGIALDVSTYVAQTPTPGATNVIVLACDGGTITVNNSTTALEICSDLPDQPLTWTTSSTVAGDSYVYIVTDDLNNIVLISNTPEIDVDNLGSGDLRVWGLSYTGELDPSTTTVGLPATGIVSSECLDLSNNFVDLISVICNPESCDGGVLSTLEGATSFDVCIDGTPDIINLQTTSISEGTYEYVLTTSTNTFIQLIPSDFDLNGLAAGSYNIWGVSYFDMLIPSTIEVGDDATQIETDGSCIALSQNFISVTADPCLPSPCDGGSITSSEGSYAVLCIGDDNASLELSNETTGSASYAYVLTTEDNTIVAFNIANTFIANDYTVGTYRIWGISFDGEIDGTSTEPGDAATAIATSGTCTELSANFITVIVHECVYNEGCANLFISEYVEGPSFQKAIEIFNPTNFTVDLSEYSLRAFNNGAVDFTNVLQMQGELAPGAVFIVSNSNASPELLALADTLSQVTLFNGDDALQLVHVEEVIDVVGVVGQDPGTQWVFGEGSTLDKTLVRKPSVTAGTPDWTLSTGQWLVYESGDISFLGAHTYFPCPIPPQIGFELSAASLPEEDGVISVDVTAFNILEAATVQIDAAEGTAFLGSDFSASFPIVLNFEPGTSTQTFDVTLVDDAIEEAVEFFTLELSSAIEVNWTNQALTVTIEASDINYDLYDIAEVTTTDADGVLDSLDVNCELRGVVHGVNWNGSGIHFHIMDDFDGIKVFSANQNFGYTVNEGDLVSVRGQIAQFRGQAEIRPVSIEILSTDNSLQVPIVVSGLAEGNESRMVRINCLELTNTAQWTNNPSGFFVDATDGINTVRLRMDGDTDLAASPLLAGKFSVVGIVEQDDETAPYDDSYVVWLRGLTDVQDRVLAAFNTFDELQYGDDGANFNFLSSSLGNSTNDWDFGDGTSSAAESPTHTYDFGFLSANPTFDISLTVTNDEGCSHSTSITVDAVYVSVEELTAAHWTVYPNPTVGLLNVQSNELLEELTLLDASGRIVERLNNVRAFNYVLDMNEFTAGIYFMTVHTASGVSTKLIQKQ